MKGNVVRLCTISAVVLAVASYGYSGVVRHDVDAAEYTNLANLADFAGVGRVDGATSSYNFLASGALIAPQWVLTAAHVVQDATSLSFTVNGATYSAAGYAAHSKFNSNRLDAGNDIALINLSAPITDVATAALYTGSNELGAVTTAVGYGRTGTGLTGATVHDYSKRAGQNVADAFYPVRKGTPNILLMDFDNPLNAGDSSYGSSDPLDLEYLIAPGDSGGGLFADRGAGMELIGVHSFGWGRLDGNPDSDYGDVSGHTRVSVYTSWIEEVISGQSSGGGKGNGKGGKPTSAFDEYYFVSFADTAPVPEPASLGLLALSGLSLLRRRHS